MVTVFFIELRIPSGIKLDSNKRSFDASGIIREETKVLTSEPGNGSWRGEEEGETKARIRGVFWENGEDEGRGERSDGELSGEEGAAEGELVGVVGEAHGGGGRLEFGVAREEEVSRRDGVEEEVQAGDEGDEEEGEDDGGESRCHEFSVKVIRRSSVSRMVNEEVWLGMVEDVSFYTNIYNAEAEKENKNK